jgi:lipid-A-disaccharide synthase
VTAGTGGASPFTAFLIAGEESGDQLGAGLMQALAARIDRPVRFTGVGGARMSALGLESLFPMDELALHGVASVVANIARILRRIRETAAAIVAAEPDVLVLIDVPGFNLPVARKIRQARPSIPVVDYVSPTVWAWRPGRARRMTAFVDRVLAILPFEPEVHRQLGGPPCTYVGHPLIERLSVLRSAAGERRPIVSGGKPVILILPGSRRSEVSRLTPLFGEAIALVAERNGLPEILLPAVPRLAAEIAARVAGWKVKPRIVEGEIEKFAAFRRAHAALAASGTVTLELALAGVPMVVAYKLDPLAKLFKPLIRFQMKPPVPSIVLANLVLGEMIVPEFIDGDASAEALAAAVSPLLYNSPERCRQVDAFALLDGLMSVEPDTPSGRAADAVLATVSERRRTNA